MSAPLKRISLKDIAKAAGVSVSTVSQCLLNKPGPNAQTAAKIRTLAAEMGYRPNPILSSLARSRFKHTPQADTTPIAVILHCSSSDLYPHDISRSYRCQTISKTAQALGYTVHFNRYDCISNPKNLIRELYYRGITGIIVAMQSTQDLSLILENDWSQFPLVIASNDPRLSHFHLACGNVFETIRHTWIKLLSYGYKRIGWAIFRHSHFEYDDFIRYACINECQLNTEQKYRVPLFPHTSLDDESGFEKWYFEHKPEVVVGFRDAPYFWLKNIGLRIPEDVSFCHLHADEVYTTKPDMAGIINMETSVCQASVIMLDQLIKHRSLGLGSDSCRIVITPTWKDGNSCPDLTKRKTAISEDSGP